MVSAHTAHVMRQHKLVSRRFALDKDSFIYTYRPAFKGIFHADHLPGAIGMLGAIFIFALMSLQFALMPFVALEKQTLAYQQQSQTYLASIGVKPSSQYLAENRVPSTRYQAGENHKQFLIASNHQTIKPSNKVSNSNNPQPTTYSLQPTTYNLQPSILGASTSKFSISFIDALKASIGDLFFWWPWGRTSKQMEVFEVNPTEIIIDFSYESLPQDYNPKVGEEFALDVILHQNGGDIHNIDSLNLGLTYSPSDLIFIGGLSNNSRYRNQYSSHTNIIESFFGHDFFEYADPDKKILLHLRFKRISANETRIQFVKNDLLLIDSSSPVNVTTFEKVFTELEKPVNQTEPQACIAAGGTWEEFSNGCADKCNSGPYCTQVITQGCNCPGTACWDGTKCVGANSCSENGDACKIDGDCCSSYCSLGKCANNPNSSSACNLHSTQSACTGDSACMWHESYNNIHPACKLTADYDNNESVNISDIIYILDHWSSEFNNDGASITSAIIIVLNKMNW